MNLRQLQQFVTLAECGNFHRAAERLHMAQPPLSVSIRKLEDGLDTALATVEGDGHAGMVVRVVHRGGDGPGGGGDVRAGRSGRL